MANLITRLQTHRIEIRVEDVALDYILAQSYDQNYGARPLRRWVEKHIVTHISKLLIQGTLSDDSILIVDINDDNTEQGLKFTSVKK